MNRQDDPTTFADLAEPAASEVETLLRQERRRQGHERLGILVMVSGLFVGGVVLAIGRRGIAQGSVVDVLWISATVVAILAAMTTLAFRPGENARRLKGLIGRRDRLQRGRNDQIYAVSITAWGMLASCLAPLLRIGEGQGTLRELFMVATLPFLAALILMSVGGWTGFGSAQARQNRKWLEDELTQATRARAMALGFPLLTVGIGAVYWLGLWKPEWLIAGIAVALIAVPSAVGLRFAWLDQQADAGHE